MKGTPGTYSVQVQCSAAYKSLGFLQMKVIVTVVRSQVCVCWGVGCGWGLLGEDTRAEDRNLVRGQVMKGAVS